MEASPTIKCVVSDLVFHAVNKRPENFITTIMTMRYTSVQAVEDITSGSNIQFAPSLLAMITSPTQLDLAFLKSVRLPPGLLGWYWGVGSAVLEAEEKISKVYIEEAACHLGFHKSFGNGRIDETRGYQKHGR